MRGRQRKAIAAAFYATRHGSPTLWLLRRRRARPDRRAALPRRLRRHRRWAPALNATVRAVFAMSSRRICTRTKRHTFRHEISGIHNAVLQACDANDGVKDGVIENPTNDVRSQGAGVLGRRFSVVPPPPQVDAARKMYQPAVIPDEEGDLSGTRLRQRAGWATFVGSHSRSASPADVPDLVFTIPTGITRHSTSTATCPRGQSRGRPDQRAHPDLRRSPRAAGS